MRSFKVGFLLVLLSAVTATGCAKQPRTAQTSAPAPTGPAAESVEPSPPVPAEAAAGDSTAGAGAPPTVAPVEPPRPESTSARPEVKQFTPTARLRDIHFEFDTYDIRPEDSKILDADIDWIQSNPSYVVLIEGHCDERGTNEYNVALGDHRARAALNYMLARGVKASRITTLSYGEERPVCIERTEECWARNRRAHFLVRLATTER